MRVGRGLPGSPATQQKLVPDCHSRRAGLVWTVVCVRSGSDTLGRWVELSGLKPPTHFLGKRLRGTLVGPTGSKIIVRVWQRGGKGTM